MFSLAHLSDLHTTPLRALDLPRLLNKRLLGWLSWGVRRRHYHRPEVLEALIADLAAVAPDAVAITGDLTNVALPHEFPAARAWLERIGPPDRVFAVPGNHDAYVPIPRADSWDHWAEYLAGDASPPDGDFPTVRVRGPLGLVGVNSAIPTSPLRATGRVGAAQLERLEKILGELGSRGLFRVVLLHHPVVEGTVSHRRRLLDEAATRDVLRRAGAELVLHGHAHRTCFGEIDGPAGPVPVVGVRSASDYGQRDHRRAQYHVYTFAPDASGRLRATAHIRGFDPARGRFAPESERAL